MTDPLLLAGAALAGIALGYVMHGIHGPPEAQRSVEEPPAFCPYCNQSFASVNAGIRHANDAHNAPSDEYARGLLEVNK